LERKILGLVLSCLAAALFTGCGGINASHSISPASFFLPGLGQTQPEAAPVQAPPASSSQSASLKAAI
jgi:hypothetical protein